MSEKQVGGEVDAYCTKCKLVLAHTILAKVGEKIARVRCNTCMGEHAYRANPPGTRKAATKTKKTTTTRRKTAAPKEEAKPFETLFTDESLASAVDYSPKGRFAKGDVIRHPTFGIGLVDAIRDDKLDAIFKIGNKTLIHTAGDAPVVFEKSPRGDGGSSSSADKPPPGERPGLHAVSSPPPTELPQAESKD